MIEPTAGPLAWVNGSDAPENTEINLGFMALSDCASVVVAATQGFAQPFGLTLNLKRQSSWASLRDNLVNGQIAPPVAVRRLDSSCPGGNTDAHWNCGWRVFVDSNGNGTQDSGEATLQTVEQNGMVQIVHSADATVLRLDRYGGVVGITGQHSFALAPAADPDAAGPAGKRMLCLSPGARIKAEEGSTC